MIRIAIRIQSVLQNLIQTLVSSIRIVFLSKIHGGIPKLKLHNSCVILGNGPSLANSLQQHEQFVRATDACAVNMFANTPWFTIIQPRFYVILAPELWQDNAPEHMKQEQTTLFSNIAKVTWDVYVYAPSFAKKSTYWKQFLLSNTHISMVWFNATPIEGFTWFKHMCFNTGIGMPRPHNILTPALMMAIRQKYNEVYILGADHSWLTELYVADTNDVYLTQKHFYDEQTAQAKHMYTTSYEKRKLHEILHKFMCAFSSYFEIQAYARTNGVKIWNATPGSFIDAFDRCKLS
ncbi:MAG TPA: hypothetical protein PK734_05335 [Bacteroidales bacterium]|nr:MAG: hypothetical protein BWY22_01238 [Bacteroidetes bacterium ADurb.Bin217]HPM12895.1 hypothetical protein [Bacteroidales bacterium]